MSLREVLVFVYPSYVGIFQGINKGNLKDTLRTIPKAGYSALTTSLVLYLALCVCMAASVDNAFLRDEENSLLFSRLAWCGHAHMLLHGQAHLPTLNRPQPSSRRTHSLFTHTLTHLLNPPSNQAK